MGQQYIIKSVLFKYINIAGKEKSSE